MAGNEPLVEALQKRGAELFGEPISTSGTLLYTDVRLYGEAGVPAAIYGAGPCTVFESNAKRADEHLVLDDLKRATKVVARSLFDLLQQASRSPSPCRRTHGTVFSRAALFRGQGSSMLTCSR